MARKTYFTQSVYLTPKHIIARALNRPVRRKDEQGNRCRILTGSIHPQHVWIAWIEDTQPYTLNITVDGKTVFTWLMETDHEEKSQDRPLYEIKYFSWYSDTLVLIFSAHYSWKTEEDWSRLTYFCGRVFTLQGLQTSVDLPMQKNTSFEGQVIEHTLYLHDYYQHQRTVYCYALPLLKLLPALSYEEAYQQNILINLDALTPMQTVHMRDFLLTGFFGKITIGMKRAELESLVGLPMAWGTENQLYRAGIWKYGSIEFHFNEHDAIFLIYSDYLNPLEGGHYLNVDPWILDASLTLSQIQALLEQEDMGYQQISDQKSRVEYLEFSSGVKLGFLQRLDEDTYRLFSFAQLLKVSSYTIS